MHTNNATKQMEGGNEGLKKRRGEEEPKRPESKKGREEGIEFCVE